MADENSKLDDNRKGSLLFASDLTQQAETRRVTPDQPLPIKSSGYISAPRLQLAGQTSAPVITPSAGKRLRITHIQIKGQGFGQQCSLEFQTSGIVLDKTWNAGFCPGQEEVDFLGAVDEALTAVNDGPALNGNATFAVNYREE